MMMKKNSGGGCCWWGTLVVGVGCCGVHPSQKYFQFAGICLERNLNDKCY